ncbi:uncharacterized protein LOC128184881 [Crassostrea angulata]|uniref:uncharacterized protein LOC128184881 n=1 Tax=Magallana angulata TaxID=2784310 RepID=UPI0022B0A6E7|nr:uncharacterized protein LOC128184881 [Crassostrea angulata]XP_052710476.1 uncharacterized protein LOC128184881 [Crassostrea angulata]XP_052710477.1 uncharacterized protein LOC128184881 [Crassostrea angulata]
MPTKNEIKELFDREREKSDQLESEVLLLHRRLKKAEHELSLKDEEMKQKRDSNPNKTVFVAREKKIARLCGRPVKESDPDVAEWLDDARQHLKVINDNDARIDFLMDNLGGQAKDEIRLRPRLERDTAEKILEIIKSVFASTETPGALQQQFYQRDQKHGESLQNYSLALMKLLDKIVAKDENAVTDFDEMLKERFVEGIRNSSLRREIRRFSFEKKAMSFGEFRQKVLQWSEDYKNEPLSKSFSAHEITSQESVKSKVVKDQSEDQLSEILKILKLQQTQIDENQKELKKLSEAMKTSKPQYENKYLQGRQFPNVRQSHLTCFRCGGKGHKEQDCSTQLDTSSFSRKGKSQGASFSNLPLNEKRLL